VQNDIAIGNFVICSLISGSILVSIHDITVMLKIIGQCDIKRIMTLPIKTITEVLDGRTLATLLVPLSCLAPKDF
jgi:D-arabinose 1-dehydrogenase-like Zn-dependent alcohol dehydrogenase